MRFPLSRFLVAVFLVGSVQVYGQNERDTVRYLEPVNIQAYFVPQPYIRSTAASAVIGQSQLGAQQGTSLLPALNGVPGVRMEERSPGSYRLSIRGSLLRSPYGVRNVKVYLEDIPLTDAGGNTYLNLLDPGTLAGAEILKGPDGSIFGANSGGVLLLSSSKESQVQVQGGSYGLLHQQAGVHLQVSPQYEMSWNQSFQRSDGYRDNSAMRKVTLQTSHRWRYNPKNNNEIRLLALYGDLDYRTPGGLTLDQLEQNPRAARPATATLPGAVEQRAGIRNQTWMAGLTHDWRISKELKHILTVFGSHTDFSNPFITNYEKRLEGNAGVRTYLTYLRPLGDSQWTFQSQVGLEWQGGDYTIENYDNHQGVRGAEQASDELKASSGTAFMRVAMEQGDKWLLEAALSRNTSEHQFRSRYPVAELEYQQYGLAPAWMPRVALSYMATPSLVWRALVSKGFSPPTTAEIRPADNVVNTSLRAETGWNYETGWRFQTADRRFLADVSVFHYEMKDALIRGTRESGAEYFRNGGGIRQLGVEFISSAWMKLGASQMLWSGSWAWSDFRFGQYEVGTQDRSGNRLTGVPKHTLSNSIRWVLPHDWQLGVNHMYSSSLPLNDANAFYADAYHILQAKVEWALPFYGNRLTLFAGADNLLNQQYSLGYDINAFGNRFYNPAPLRSYYGGVKLSL